MPDVATEVPRAGNGISADAKTYTFTLRSGVMWDTTPPRAGDGGRFRARVQDTLQSGLARRRARLLHEHDRWGCRPTATASPRSSRPSPRSTATSGPRARGRASRRDAQTLVFKLRSPRRTSSTSSRWASAPRGRSSTRATCPTARRCASTRSRTARTGSPRTCRRSRSPSSATRPGDRAAIRFATPTSTPSRSPKASRRRACSSRSKPARPTWSGISPDRRRRICRGSSRPATSA